VPRLDRNSNRGRNETEKARAHATGLTIEQRSWNEAPLSVVLTWDELGEAVVSLGFHPCSYTRLRLCNPPSWTI
jgi:hypothetical protein